LLDFTIFFTIGIRIKSKKCCSHLFFESGFHPIPQLPFLADKKANVKKSAPTNLPGRFAPPSSGNFRNSPRRLRDSNNLKFFTLRGGGTHLEVSKGIGLAEC